MPSTIRNWHCRGLKNPTFPGDQTPLEGNELRSLPHHLLLLRFLMKTLATTCRRKKSARFADCLCLNENRQYYTNCSHETKKAVCKNKAEEFFFHTIIRLWLVNKKTSSNQRRANGATAASWHNENRLRILGASNAGFFNII